MKIAFLFAMEEEAKILSKLSIKYSWQEHNGFKICSFDYNHHQCYAIISGVGISFSAAACAILIEKFDPEVIINIGLAGGINSQIGDVVIAQKAIFHDVDVTALDYPMHQIPSLPVIIESKENYIKKFGFQSNYNLIILSGNQFVNNYKYAKELSNKYENAKAIEMEAASIASICHKAGKNFLFIKKISDLADENSKESFRKQTPDFHQKITAIIKTLLDFGAPDRIRT